MKRGISFSEYDCYIRSKKKWHDRYIIGEKYEATRPQLFGDIIHKEISEPGHLIDRLTEEGFDTKEKIIARKLIDGMQDRRPEQHDIYREAEIEEGITVLGFYDGLDDDPLYRLQEHKTSGVPDDHYFGWNQYKVDNSLQLTVYALIEYYKNRKLFHEMLLNRLSTKTGRVKTYRTNRSRTDIETLKAALIHYATTLKKEGLWTKRKSRKEIENMTIDDIKK